MSFEIDDIDLPFVRTRQALLLLDLQNDFISTKGILPVDQPPDFLDKTFKLLPEFRTAGNIIWIRSVFEESRAINEPVGNSESVITDNELAPKTRDRKLHLQAHVKPSRSVAEPEQAPEKNDTRVVDDGVIEPEEDEEDTKVEETYLTLRPGQLPQAFLPTSPGTNISQAASMHIDAKKDLIFQKSWYSAFKDGSLVQLLRAKFVTEIYLCGALTNISVFATAMDAARHGYSITIVEDCLGYRSKARHDEALRRLVEFAGCDIISSEELIEDLRHRARKLQAAPKRNQYQRPQPKPKVKVKEEEKEKASTSSGIENLMAGLNLRPDGTANPPGHSLHVAAAESGDQASEVEECSPIKSSTDDGKKRERVKAKIKTRRRHSKLIPKEGIESSSAKVEWSLSSTTLITATQALQRLPNSFLSETEQALAPTSPATSPSETVKPAVAHSDSSEGDTTPSKMSSTSNGRVVDDSRPIAYCEGDTSVVYNLLDETTAAGIFEKLRDEVRWQRMSHQGGDVPRLVAVQGEIGKDGYMPLYRHPADDSPPLLTFSPTVDLIRKEAEKKLGHTVNHVLIQFYRDSTDHITEHSDKTLDIVRNTYICNVSLGAQRTMTFRTKKPLKGTPEAEGEQLPRQVQKIPLPHNSMAKVGLETNMRWLHAIRPDKRMDREKSPEELAFNSSRISFTFRKIGTFLSKDETKIWGQGAVSKSKETARFVINGNATESEKMIRAFSKENSSSEFDWDAVYGAGFDVLHISNWPKLILSGDAVSDLRVKLTLAEYGITWLETKSSTAFNWKDSKDTPQPTGEPVKFIDNDSAQSTVTGDLAIILYLTSIYSPTSSKPTPNPSLAKQLTRLHQSTTLLQIWQHQPFSLISLRSEMQLWNTYVKEGPYIAGSEISMADFAVWPVLEVMRREWRTIEGFEDLVRYYEFVRGREGFVKVLGPKEEGGK